MSFHDLMSTHTQNLDNIENAFKVELTPEENVKYLEIQKLLIEFQDVPRICKLLNSLSPSARSVIIFKLGHTTLQTFNTKGFELLFTYCDQDKKDFFGILAIGFRNHEGLELIIANSPPTNLGLFAVYAMQSKNYEALKIILEDKGSNFFLEIPETLSVLISLSLNNNKEGFSLLITYLKLNNSKLGEGLTSFHDMLAKLETKIGYLQENKYTTAEAESRSIVKTLRVSGSIFFSQPFTQDSIAQFKKDYSEALEDKNTVSLRTHRATFGEIRAIIMNFFNFFFNRSTPLSAMKLFDARTNSAKTVDNLRDDFDNLIKGFP